MWETHIKQRDQISKGHWSTTCNYYNEYWYKGSSAALENYLGSTLKTLADENLIEGGSLKQWVDTHWHTMYDCVFSIISKHRTWLSLSKIKNKQKLSAFYLANSKKELPYFSANNSTEDLYEVLSNMNLSDDDDYDEKQPASEEVQNVKFLEEKVLKIKELLNLDIADFTNNLGEIVFDTNFESFEEENVYVQINDIESNVDKEIRILKKKLI
ncbi:4848_t:CDS:2 [Scutellospora calospora]|uniref:4848_t:CDS:1 n=1 Tax=Scutellospora calospora TaxID=85575 RepID=A0ACA9JWC5_9GLOM|nr:4848_t:CDS:2 [Scutellospora calospora]